MTTTMDTCGAAILAGGRSSRMGCCKAKLMIGGTSMVSRLLSQLSGFQEVLLSANDPTLAEGLQIQVVQDLIPGAGPLSGIHACLSAAKSDALLVIPCDLPNYSSAVGQYLLGALSKSTDAVVCRDSTGRVHPLCGIYRKQSLPILEECLMEGEFRARTFLERLNHTILDTGTLVPDAAFFNMNTPEDYRSMILKGDGEHSEQCVLPRRYI